MKKILKNIVCGFLAFAMVLSITPVYAEEGDDEVSEDEEITVTSEDEEVVVTNEDKPYLALGNDLRDSELNTVLSLLGVDKNSLSDYDVVYITNQEEHEYLDSYIPSSTIGTRALSSVVVIEDEESDGVTVTTKNINYCTPSMYENAMITAGISSAKAIVAGPFEISGTAALIGVIKAYSVMTGEEINEDNVDAALNEMVVTGEIKEDSDSDDETVEGLVAYLKEQVASDDLSEEEISEAIDEAQNKFDVDLSDEQISSLESLLQKIDGLDLDSAALKQQAESLADKLGISEGGFFSGILNFFRSIWNSIKSFFTNIVSSSDDEDDSDETVETQEPETEDTTEIEDPESEDESDTSTNDISTVYQEIIDANSSNHYAYYDINDDNQDELLIGDSSYNVTAIYTYNGQSATMVLEAYGTTTIDIYPNGIVVKKEDNDTSGTYQIYSMDVNGYSLGLDSTFTYETSEGVKTFTKDGDTMEEEEFNSVFMTYTHSNSPVSSFSWN